MEKYILFAGRKVPISTTYNVVVFDNEMNQSFYAPEKTLSPADLLQMQLIRPELHPYSFRAGLNREANQLFGLDRSEVDELGQRITQIAFHHDVTSKATDTFNVLCKRGLSTHFDINYDGTLYQFMDCYHTAWATGDNNSMSIAIDMNNPVFPDTPNDPAQGLRDIFQGKINGSLKTMLGYTDAQYETLIALLKALLLPMQVPGEPDWTPLPVVAASCFPPITESGEIINRLLKNPTSFVGMLGHYHCSANKWDPGPAFDWMRVLSGIKGQRNSFPILLDQDKRNLSNVAGDALKNLLDTYYHNTEASEGGWYPIGVNQSWHSGVHISSPEKTPVYNMMSGRIVAVRNVKRVTLGDPSFVLVKHERVETGHDGKNKSVFWYSLFMHLRQQSYPDEMSKIPWIRTLLGDDITVPDDILINYDANKFTPEKGVPQSYDAVAAKSPESIRSAFFRGDILLVDIPVEPGEQIGVVGRFGDLPSKDDQPSQIHVEVFSEENIFQTRNGQKDSWSITEGDSSDYSLVRVKRILRPIQEFAQTLTGQMPTFIKSSEIQNFFLEPDEYVVKQKLNMRKMICYHRSEWSPLMNWTKTAVQTVGWQWENESAFGDWLLLWLPFQWLTNDVASALEFNDKHFFFTYHPIYLLEQFNSSYAGDIRKTAEEASDDEAELNRQQLQKNIDRLLELNTKRKKGEPLTDEEKAEIDSLYAVMDDHMGDNHATIEYDTKYDYYHDMSFDEWEPGEWPPPKTNDDFM